MKLIEMTQVSDELAEMVALFRVELHSYKGIVSKPNIEACLLYTSPSPRDRG